MTSAETVLRGTPVVPGVAAGPVVHARGDVSAEAVARFREGEAPGEEAALASYDEAVRVVAGTFTRRAATAQHAAAQVLTASAAITRDRALRAAVTQHVRGGQGLVAAVHAAIDQFATVFAAMGGLMGQRVTDLRDIERRLVAHVVGEPAPGVPTPETPSVLVATDLPPSDASVLDPDLVTALVTERGGATGHTAIIARQLGIPCVVGVTGAATLEPGAFVVVDGEAGTVEQGVGPELASRRVARSRELRAELARWTGPAATADGMPVQLLANVADAASAERAAAEPVEGVGLFRTEMCFLGGRDEPSPEEQSEVYAAVLAPYVGRHVVVRTLDAGADKPVGFATHEAEGNPALGMRGLRMSAGNPGLLDRQLDAISSAAERTGTETWVMAPMVATVAEAAEFAAKVRGRGLRAGVMVEVPSAALLAHRMLEVVDFLSIGTNDLTQYAMAADRAAADLAYLTDPWQPAVLQLVAITAHAGREAGKPVGVCGEAAADPLLATALVGMGVTSLSMAARAVRPVGAQLARVTSETCEEAAEVALGAADPMAGRDAVRDLLGR